MVGECRLAALSLNLFAGNEPAGKLNCPLGGLAAKLQQLYGVEMSPHGVSLDTDTVRAIYLTAAKREAYRVLTLSGKACHNRTLQETFRPIHSDQVEGIGFAVSMSNELCVGAVGGIAVKFHSFFMAGMPVQCAGHMWFHNGRVTRVRNSSGRYKPVDAALVRVLNHLRIQGMDLSQIVVEPVQFVQVGTNVLGQSQNDIRGDVIVRQDGNWDAILTRAGHQAPL